MAAPERRQWLASAARTCLWAGSLAALAGCGFQLRRPARMPFERIALTGFAPRSPMEAELRQLLQQQISVIEVPSQADVVLQAMADQRTRTVVATTSAAQVRELQLRVRLQFRLHTPGGRELAAPVELLLSRDFSYNETQALAKQQEEAQLFRDMQSDVALQVLRRLSAVRL